MGDVVAVVADCVVLFHAHTLQDMPRGVVVGMDGGHDAGKAEGFKAVAQGCPGGLGRNPLLPIGLGQPGYYLDVCAVPKGFG